ncbi:hypothetical protein GCM10018785_70890 [Streptomyces longispororuber]|uniref:Lipoprotein n=1 Tax=Streptomyces longispororuber TaxID=68230 RepID=A0A919AB10_9ACTN|nr:hypothetical protein [Streptomyces longispororuber]GHE95507.1 hypothetical protein GCM10018785_70890 [Streptomyces longispororuber]
MAGMSRARGRTASAVCVTAALALLVPACASDDDGGDGDGKGRRGGKAGEGDRGTAALSAREISDRARRALLGAKSVHIEVEDRSKDAEKDDPAHMDLALDRDGNCAGTMGFARGGGRAELVKRGDKVWLKPDDAFWRNQLPRGQGEAAAELFKGRYLHGTTRDEMLRDLSEICDLKELQSGVDDDPEETKGLKKGGGTTVAGTRVVPLTATEDGADKALYVASEGTPYPIRITQKDGDSDQTTTFSDYDEPVPVRTPAAKESLDIAKLEKRLRQP